MAEQPFNELGQILAQGGEIALGLAIAAGWTDTQIAALFAKRFEPMRPSDRQRLTDLARRAVNAAYNINDLPHDENVPIGDIPVNDELFGEDSEGRRGFWVGEYSPDGGQTWIQIRIMSPDFGTVGEILEEIEDRGKEIVSQYPDRLNRLGGDIESEGVARVTFIERKF